MRQTFQPRTAGALQGLPVRFDLAVQRGASCMGLTSLFVTTRPSRRDIADDRLAALGCLPSATLLNSIVRRNVAVFCDTEIQACTIPVLTWGGMRGGISVALALPIPEVAEKSAILAATYAEVIFTLIVQRLSLRTLIQRVLK